MAQVVRAASVFSYEPYYRVDSVSPKRGTTLGGDLITVFGKFFGTDPTKLSVTIGTVTNIGFAETLPGCLAVWRF